MKKFTTTLCMQFLLLGFLSAQAYNTTLRDQLDYAQDLNDVWGYVAPDGTEYALVGLYNGVSIVSLADPDNIVEVDFIGGDNSTWRDLKTFGEYAYIVADSGNDGVLIINLSNLPGPVSHQYVIPDPPGSGTIQQAHNIFIDESTGLAYIAGADVNSGGMVIYDVATTPGTLIFEAFAPSIYAHDVFVQDGKMYASEINVGRLAIYDVSDVANITLLGTRDTPYAFTHNAWTTIDGNFVFTTDERANASTAAYDISNPANPILLDEFRPDRSLGQGVIPHNVHVLNEYLVISHYTDGVEIVDASVPDHLVEVGYFDNSTISSSGFFGSWGAYPFLPSGLILSSDIENGLQVIAPNYIRAARLSGTITENSLGGPAINAASIVVSSPQGISTSTDAGGDYRVGTAESGTFNVTISAPGYQSLVVPVDFVNGTLEVLDTFLTLIQQVSVAADVSSTVDNGAIAAAPAMLTGEGGTFLATSNGSGALTFNSVPMGDYELIVGKWGYQNASQFVTVSSSSSFSVQMTPGYLDGFAIDQGWTTGGTASTGDWERGIPNGTTNGGLTVNPDEDVSGGTDLGELAYVTGNSGGSAGADDIDGGNVVLTSPVLDLSLFPDNNVYISYSYWFANQAGSGTPDDEMTIAISNGTQTVVAKTYDISTTMNAWVADSFLLTDLPITITNDMRVIVTAEDTGNGHLAEAGFDNFKVAWSAALPVEFLSFFASPALNGKVQLDWATASESSNDYFKIERSTDGRNYNEIGQVNGVGNTSDMQTYEFLDETPISGGNFYRLEQLDFDGTSTYSEIRYVEISKNAISTDWQVFPNPAGAYLQLTEDVEGEISLYNQQGQLLRQFRAIPGHRIDLSGIEAGLYWLKAADRTIRFVKY